MSYALNYVTDSEADRRRLHRDHVECILGLAKYLPETDRLLIEQVYRHGIAISDIARLNGHVSRNVRRRVTRLLERINSPLFQYVIAYRDRRGS